MCCGLASMVAQVWRGAPGPAASLPARFPGGAAGCAAIAGFMTGSHGSVFSCVFVAPEGFCQGQMQASVAQGLTLTLRRLMEAGGVGTARLAREVAPGAPPLLLARLPLLRFSGFSGAQTPSVTPCGCWGAWGGSPLPCRWEAAGVSALG